MTKAMKLQIAAICVLLVILSVECSRDDVNAPPPDVESPSYVNDLQVTCTTISSVTFRWRQWLRDRSFLFVDGTPPALQLSPALLLL